MTKIVGATRHECCGIGEISINIPENEAEGIAGEVKSQIVDGKDVKLQPNDIAVQHVEDGSTRVICDHLSNGHGSPEMRNHCLKIIHAIEFACSNVLTGSPIHNHGSEITRQTMPCRWSVPPIDENKKQ
jgi:hypothetical protein